MRQSSHQEQEAGPVFDKPNMPDGLWQEKIGMAMNISVVRIESGHFGLVDKAVPAGMVGIAKLLPDAGERAMMNTRAVFIVQGLLALPYRLGLGTGLTIPATANKY
jgi:hypothetical protein